MPRASKSAAAPVAPAAVENTAPVTTPNGLAFDDEEDAPTTHRNTGTAENPYFGAVNALIAGGKAKVARTTGFVGPVGTQVRTVTNDMDADTVQRLRKIRRQLTDAGTARVVNGEPKPVTVRWLLTQESADSIKIAIYTDGKLIKKGKKDDEETTVSAV